MKLDTNLCVLILLAISPVATYAADNSEEIVINAFITQITKYDIEKLSHCRFKMSVTIGAESAPSKQRIVKNYYFGHVERASVTLTKSYLAQVGAKTDILSQLRPYAVEIEGQQLYIWDAWWDPNPYNLPPSFGKAINKDTLFCSSEDYAKQFKVAIVDYAKTCN